MLVLLLITATFNSFAQDSNPALRYANAYQQYLTAECPLPEDDIQHFIYFSRSRELIQDHPLLRMERIAGAQIMYSWRQLEREKGVYDFTVIHEDYEYLKSHGKKLFIQLQDVTFNLKYKAVPEYILSDEYDGGCVMSLNDEGNPDGWIAKRWNKKVRERFALLLAALGNEFDGKIEGINLQETAIGANRETDPTFTSEVYVESLKENMLALKTSFPNSTTMIYANFIPGEWLPWEDKGYLRSIYNYGEEIGVGLGGPDLMVRRKGQLNHTIAMMHENEFSVPLGIAVQDGNYIGITGADSDYDTREQNESVNRNNIVPLLHAFAKDFMGVSYMFWVHQEPYIFEDVLPCIAEE